MLSKTEIFEKIQEIIQNDYAGFQSKAHLNKPNQYRVTNEMSESAFEEMIQQYLLDFNDGHLWFKSKRSVLPYRGFAVRRYEDTLYVTESPKESRLAIGDAIIRVDDQEIEALSKKHHKILQDSVHERQRWDLVLSRAEKVTITRDGQAHDIKLQEYERAPYEPAYSFQMIEDQVGYLKITDFLQAEPIERLIAENHSVFDSLENLIIDVRVNNGGNDAFYFPLLPYIFDETISFKALFHKDEVTYTNYTEANYERWIPALKEYLKQDLEEDTKRTLIDEIALWEKNKGQGLLEVTGEVDFLIEGKESPANIYVLSDFFNGSSGETFVKNVKKSPKVTVLGRPTMGIMDIFNVITVDFGEYDFYYGISKSADQHAYNGIGIQPDIYIPWTSAHLEKDVDLEIALDLITKKESN